MRLGASITISKKMKSTPHTDNLVRHALATLPDSLTARKALLTDIVATLNKGTELHAQVVTMLTHLTAHERMQEKLKF